MRDNVKNEKSEKNGKNEKSAIQTLLLINMFLILCAAIGILGFLKWKTSQKKTEYLYISLSEEAAARAYIWLDQIEDMPLDYAQVKERFGEIRLKVILTPLEERGKYIQSLAEGTYAECLEQAKSGLERAYRDVVRYRLAAAELEGGTTEGIAGRTEGGTTEGIYGENVGEVWEAFTDEMLDELMREAYGVSVAEYLEACEIPLLPTLEELTERYSGEIIYEQNK